MLKHRSRYDQMMTFTAVSRFILSTAKKKKKEEEKYVFSVSLPFILANQGVNELSRTRA
ncbi:hypothetical protein Hanom_Chr03g00217001 [Helianthus anomalus]